MALAFVSGNPRVNLGSLTDLSSAAQFTIAAWVKIGSTSRDLAIAVRGSDFSGSAPLLFWRDDIAGVSGRTNTLSALINTDAGLLRVESAADLLNDTSDWHHVAVVFEAEKTDGLRLFVDGQRDANTTSTSGHTQTVANTSDVTLSMASATHTFLGDMAEVAIWGSALADGQISQLARGFTPTAVVPSLDGLVAYQDFIRPLNRPGLGPTVTSTGTFGQAEHPRVIAPNRGQPFVSFSPSLLPGPYRRAAGMGTVVGPEEGQVSITGAESGALTPIGEVDS